MPMWLSWILAAIMLGAGIPLSVWLIVNKCPCKYCRERRAWENEHN